MTMNSEARKRAAESALSQPNTPRPDDDTTDTANGPQIADPLDAIRARLAAVTPGPWERVWQDPIPDGDGEFGWWVRGPHGETVAVTCEDYAEDVVFPKDAEFIAHAPADLAHLLAEVDQLNERAETQFDLMAEQCAEHERTLTAERDAARAEAATLSDSLTRSIEDYVAAKDREWAMHQERDAARAALTALRAVLIEWGAIPTDDVTGIDAGDDLADNIRENGAWRLVRDLAAVLAKHAKEGA